MAFTAATLWRGLRCENHTGLSKLERRTPLLCSWEFFQRDSVQTWLLLDPTCCHSVPVLLPRNVTSPNFQSIHIAHKTTVSRGVRPHLLKFLSLKKKVSLRFSWLEFKLQSLFSQGHGQVYIIQKASLTSGYLSCCSMGPVLRI